MKDYEFLRWLAEAGTGGTIILGREAPQQLNAIADQIEKLSNTPELTERCECELSCGHSEVLTNPRIGETLTCGYCLKSGTVTKIWFKDPPPIPPELIKHFCQLSCGHKRYLNNPRVGELCGCPTCGRSRTIVATY